LGIPRLGKRIGIARGMDVGDGKPADNNFTLTGSKSVSEVDISPAALMAMCLAENERRFAGYDNRPAASHHDSRDCPAVLLPHPEAIPHDPGRCPMKVKVGSETHKELFCRQFLKTHELYDPATLPWAGARRRTARPSALGAILAGGLSH